MTLMDYAHWRNAGYITAADAARCLGLPCPTVHRWMRTGKLRFALQGRRHFVKVDDFEEFVCSYYSDPAVAEAIVADARLLLKGKPRKNLALKRGDR